MSQNKIKLDISVMAGSGGVGKSTIGLEIATVLDSYLISNDPTSRLDLVYKDYKYTNPIKIIENEDFNFVYDFAGHLTPEMKEASKKSDIVIIVTDTSNHGISGTATLLQELKYKDCIVIANKIGLKGYEYNTAKAKKDFEKIENAFKNKFHIDVLPMRYTRIAQDSLDTGITIKEQTITEKRTVNKRLLTENAQLEQIIKRIKKDKFKIILTKH